MEPTYFNLVKPQFCRVDFLTPTVPTPYVEPSFHPPTLAIPYLHRTQCHPGCSTFSESLSIFIAQLQRSHHSCYPSSALNNVVLIFLQAWQITLLLSIRGSGEDAVHLRARVRHQEGATKAKNSMERYREVSMEGRQRTRSSTANGEITSSASE